MLRFQGSYPRFVATEVAANTLKVRHISAIGEKLFFVESEHAQGFVFFMSVIICDLNESTLAWDEALVLKFSVLRLI